MMKKTVTNIPFVPRSGGGAATESSRHRELAPPRPRAAPRSDEALAKWWGGSEVVTACFVMNKALQAAHLEHFEPSASWGLNTPLIPHSFPLFFSFSSVCRLSVTRHLLDLIHRVDRHKDNQILIFSLNIDLRQKTLSMISFENLTMS